ncbi:MAG: 3D domain-containing protein [Acidobacteria bacterium]|nr:3D domain-containing protein [Acidobacteriota bacterium]
MRQGQQPENVWGVAVALFAGFLLVFSASFFIFSLQSTPSLRLANAPVAVGYQDLFPVPKESLQTSVLHQVAATTASDYQVFKATAYSIAGITFSGVRVAEGIVAADPEILPIGSVIEVRADDYSGIYTVLDTGSLVQGRHIDIYLRDTQQAIEFGRRPVKVRVLRYGWTISSRSLPPFKSSPTG